MTSWRGHPSCVAPCQGETYLCVAIGERCAFLRKLFHWNVARLLTRDDPARGLSIPIRLLPFRWKVKFSGSIRLRAILKRPRKFPSWKTDYPLSFFAFHGAGARLIKWCNVRPCVKYLIHEVNNLSRESHEIFTPWVCIRECETFLFDAPRHVEKLDELQPALTTAVIFFSWIAIVKSRKQERRQFALMSCAIHRVSLCPQISFARKTRMLFTIVSYFLQVWNYLSYHSITHGNFDGWLERPTFTKRNSREIYNYTCIARNPKRKKHLTIRYQRVIT